MKQSDVPDIYVGNSNAGRRRRQSATSCNKHKGDMTMKKTYYAYKGKTFRYDWDNALVAWVTKANKEMMADNEEWREKYGKNLWDIDEKGYIEVDTYGLRNENWKDKETRNEYLDGFIAEMEYFVENAIY